METEAASLNPSSVVTVPATVEAASDGASDGGGDGALTSTTVTLLSRSVRPSTTITLEEEEEAGVERKASSKCLLEVSSSSWEKNQFILEFPKITLFY